MQTLKLADREISTAKDAFVMGIINATPDSFWQESRVTTAIRAYKLIEEGADILDIGGESTRPGSMEVPEEEEIIRIIPLIREIRKHSDIPISVDTRKKNVMEAAWNEGADIINDISALEFDKQSVKFCAKHKLPVILMHKKGEPENMQENVHYEKCFEEVNNYLKSRAEFAIKNGIEKEKIILDPGIGFGKNLEHNLELIKNCGKFADGEYKILMALSRKRFISEVCHNSLEQRLTGTLTANLIAVQNGASMVRVHDVKEAVDSLEMLKALS